MSQSTSLSSPPASSAASLERRRARRRLRPVRLAFLLLIVCIVALFVPDSFRFIARELITIEAWRAGISAHLGEVDGSLLEPITLRDSVWIYESDTGPITRVEIQSATAEFDWHNLLPRSTGHVFQRLILHGVSGKTQLPLGAVTATPARFAAFKWHLPRPSGNWLPPPERIEARDVDFVFQSNQDFVRLADTDFTLSEQEAGTIHAGQIVLKQPWINRAFRNVRGTTAIQDTKVEIANLALDPDVQVRSLSAELDDLARGRLNLDMQVAAFGGNIRVAAQALGDTRPLVFEATGTFSQIGLAKLAPFLGYNDAAGGTIKEGKFSFRGPPQRLAQATASLRFEATNFQWDSRQWDSLVLGATLMEGRVQVPELSLTQGHNRLNLSGEMPLPAPGVEWWQTEFNVNIAAKIDNLTELSALMLPDFQYTAGKANIDGSIRGKDQQFHGQLIISGSDLKWHNAPIEELQAGVKLNGNEFQFTNVSIFNNGDYLRGHGVVNILGDKQYWGEFHASIEDLAKYAAILQKPIVPEPLAGGAVIDWSGEGSAKGHSGQFSARLRKLRSLGASASLLHPINADFEGNYAPGMMLFDRFMLSDDDSSFTANIGIGNKALSLQGIRLMHRQTLWLEGDAILPLDVWNAWPNTSLATLLDDHTVSKVNLTAYDLNLHDAALLTGLNFPIQGVVRGNVTAEGPLGALKTGGKLTLNKGQIPIGWSGYLLTVVQGEAALDGQTLQIAKLTGLHPSGDFSATGQVDFTNLRDPALKLEVATTKSKFDFMTGSLAATTATGGGKFQITGPVSAATISGDAQISYLEMNAALENSILSFFAEGGVSELPSVFAFNEKPWCDWKCDVAVHASSATVGTQRSVRYTMLDGTTANADLKLQGSGRTPELLGNLTFQVLNPRVSINTRGAEGPLTLESAKFEFREGHTHDPSFDLKLDGSVFDKNFAAYGTGTLQHPFHFFVFEPPLTEKIIVSALNASLTHQLFGDPISGLRVPSPFYDGLDVVDWATIPTPPPAPPAPAPAPESATPAPAASAAPAPPTTTPAVPTPAAAPASSPAVPARAPAATAKGAPAPPPSAPAPAPAAAKGTPAPPPAAAPAATAATAAPAVPKTAPAPAAPAATPAGPATPPTANPKQ
ncbi:hypothetical protein [Chthoniobacter flavus]|uniref:hypothetical protein n=1 Tax=Chthoniobacter flavus TaxID=191863 RepID=UPI00104CB62D|nr:hypothetical protein [Chthoniobacter flavus]